MINYRLRDELLNVFVALYNPLETPGEQFSIESLWNYILDCDWQLRQAEQVKRIPFHITPSRVDAERAIDDMRREIQQLRIDNQQTGNATEEKPVDKHSKGSWGYTGGMPFPQPTRKRGKAERL